MFIPSLSEAKAVVIGAALLGALAMGATVEAKTKNGEIERVKNAQLVANAKATAEAVAEQHRLDGVALASAKKEAVAQAAIAALRGRQLAQVKQHVTDTRTRVPYGVVRLLDGAAGGVLADTLVLPAGKSDDALTSLGWTDLATSVAGNYGNCRANAEQLDALIGSYRDSRK